MGDIVILRRLKRSERIVRFLLIFCFVIFVIVSASLSSINNTTENRDEREERPIIDTYTIDYKSWIAEQKALEKQMKKAATDLDFENAAIYRDQITELKKIRNTIAESND